MENNTSPEEAARQITRQNAFLQAGWRQVKDGNESGAQHGEVQGPRNLPHFEIAVR